MGIVKTFICDKCGTVFNSNNIEDVKLYDWFYITIQEISEDDDIFLHRKLWCKKCVEKTFNIITPQYEEATEDVTY